MLMPSSIATGLARAQAFARGVDKDKRHEHAKYMYASSEAIIAEGRKALLEGGGIAFAVIGWDFEPAEEAGATLKNKGDKTLMGAIGRIRVRYVLVHLEKGEHYADQTTTPVVPDFGRPPDKAEFGALTEAHAYTLRGLLNLPRGLDGAVDLAGRDDSDYQPGDRDLEPEERHAAGAPPPTEARARAPQSSWETLAAQYTAGAKNAERWEQIEEMVRALDKIADPEDGMPWRLAEGCMYELALKGLSLCVTRAHAGWQHSLRGPMNKYVHGDSLTAILRQAFAEATARTGFRLEDFAKAS